MSFWQRVLQAVRIYGAIILAVMLTVAIIWGVAYAFEIPDSIAHQVYAGAIGGAVAGVIFRTWSRISSAQCGVNSRLWGPGLQAVR